MHIDLHYLFIVYFLLLSIQHGLIPRLKSEARKKQSLLVSFQVLVIFYCVWIGASKNPTHEMSGFGMLIVSLGLFAWRLKVLFQMPSR